MDGGGSPVDAGSDGGVSNDENYTIESFEYVDPNPAGYHPLPDEVSTMMVMEEVAHLIPATGNGGWVTDDPRTGGDLADVPEDGDAANFRIHSRLAANLDNDGADELVTVALATANGHLRLRIIDSSPGVVFDQTHTLDIATTFDDVTVSAADVDGDGIDELVVATSNRSTGGWVRVYELDGTGIVKVGVDIAATAVGTSTHDAVVGDFDGDGAMEFALAQANNNSSDTLKIEVFDDIASGAGLLKTLTAAPFTDGSVLDVLKVRLHAGNFDDDAPDELALVADAFDSGSIGLAGLRFHLIDDSSSYAVGAAISFGGVAGSLSGYVGDNRWPWRSDPADMNGDGTLELVVAVRQANEPNFDWILYHQVMPAELDAWSGGSSKTLYMSGSADMLADLDAVADKSGTDDELDSFGDALIATVRNGTNLVRWRFGASVVGGTSAMPVFALDAGTSSNFTVANTNSPPWTVAGDFDGDSLKLRYTGNATLALANPMPIAVLAAPPFIANADQRADLGSTAYGTAVVTGTAETHEIGVTARTTFTTSASIPKIGFELVEIESNFDEAFSSRGVTTERITYGTSFRGAPNEDTIVFQGTLYNSYEYEVISALDPSEIGAMVRIDVPVETRIYKWTTVFFNESLVDWDFAIDASVLGHTIGDPSTYPGPADRDAALSATTGWASPLATVGQGNGSIEVSLDLASESSTTDERSRSSQTTMRGPLGNALCTFDSNACRTFGFNGSEGYTVTAGESTHYAGTVGDIADSGQWSAQHYDFGLFVYWHTLTNGAQFQVVNYWVE